MMLFFMNEEHPCICQLILQGILMCCDSALEGKCANCVSSVSVTNDAQTTLFRGFQLAEQPATTDGEWSGEAVERLINNCDTAFDMFMRPVPASDPMWPETKTSKEGCDAWKLYTGVGMQVQRAFTDTFRTNIGLQPVAPDPDVLRGVSTTVLANARMVSPFCSCVFESHVPGHATRITQARQRYVAAVQKMSHGNDADTIKELHARNAELTEEVYQEKLARQVSDAALANARLERDATVAAMQKENDELKQQLADERKQSTIRAVAEHFQSGLPGAALAAYQQREQRINAAHKKRCAAHSAKAAEAGRAADAGFSDAPRTVCLRTVYSGD